MQRLKIDIFPLVNKVLTRIRSHEVYSHVVGPDRDI